MSMILSSGNLAFFLKVVVVLTCVLSVGVMLKLSVPLVSDFVASDVPSFWNVMLQWLKPPYLYIVINGIIISIVASSKLQRKDDEYDHHLSPEAAPVASEKVVASELQSGYALVYDHVRDLSGNISTVVENQGVYGWVEVEDKKVVGDHEMVMNGGDEAGDHEVEKPVIGPNRSDSMEFCSDSSEKEKGNPPVSGRFGHRKAVKASPEGGKALRVSKPRRNDTLESTWQTITEGRATPLIRHLKKADTWERGSQHNNTPPPPPTPPSKMKKSDTFTEGTSANTNTNTNETATNHSNSANSERLGKEPSPSQDDLNRRVEAFIRKFNEEMRLQRRRSFEQYN